jgi:transposase
MGRHKELPDLQQQVLAFELEPPAAGKAAVGRARFIEDAPDGLFLGAQRLDQFLRTNGLGWVVRLRSELEQLDYTAMETAYLGGGRKPYHPRTLLGLIVYGILNRAWSLRELEDLAIRDIGAWWICGGKRPDHSTIGEFIQRHRAVLTEEFFATVVQTFVRRLRIAPGVVAGDGTVVEAVASRYATLKREAAQRAAADAQARAAAAPHDEHLREQAEQHAAVAAVLEQRCQAREQKGESAEHTRVAPAEPEAVVQPRKDGVVRPAYRPSVLVHVSGLIVGQAVHPSSETAVVPQLLEQHRAVFGTEPPTALWDGGYCTPAVLQEMVERNIDVLTPAGKAKRDDGWEKRDPGGRFGKARFRYDEERNAYLCPSGQWMTQVRQGRQRGGYAYRMYATAACGDCALRAQCTTSKQQGRTVKRYEGELIKELMAEVLRQPRARDRYRQRAELAERPHAELRFRQGLTRFRRRGLAGASVDYALHCLAFNLHWALNHAGHFELFGRVLIVLRLPGRSNPRFALALVTIRATSFPTT